MTRFLAVTRRLFLGGTVALLLAIFLFNVGLSSLIQYALNPDSIKSAFSIFFLLSPILFILFTLISVTYIRKNGQFAAVHQEQAWIVTFFRCLGSDLISPFKNIGRFFMALFNRDAEGRGILIGRFFELLLLIGICAVGIFILK